jgi:predicted dienelactone hydrolase
MTTILDRLDEIEQAVPQLAGRTDRDKVAVAGHSLGSFTAELLLGARVTDPDAEEEVSALDPRITQGVLLGAIGRGGDTLNGFRSAHVPIFRTTDLTTMVTPALVVAGDKDDSQHWTTMGPDWHADPYHLAPGPCSPSSTASTFRVASKAMAALRPRTRAPNGSPRSPSSPQPTCVPPSTPTTSRGRRRGTR